MARALSQTSCANWETSLPRRTLRAWKPKHLRSWSASSSGASSCWSEVGVSVRPQALIAEITHRCPLHCGYFSNPLAMRPRGGEMPADVWTRVFREAAELGVLHVHLTGGEPVLRPDLEELVRAGRAANLYVNLITSGIGLTERKLDALIDAGLDHLQLTISASANLRACARAPANSLAGARAH